MRKVVAKGSVSYTSKSQKFSIWLPKKPDETYTDHRLKNGEKGRSYSFEALSTEVSYSLMSLSKMGLSKAAQGGGLNEMQSSIIRSWDSTLQKRQDLELGSFAGRELTLNTALNAPVRVRIFDTPRFN